MQRHVQLKLTTSLALSHAIPLIFLQCLSFCLGTLDPRREVIDERSIGHDFADFGKVEIRTHYCKNKLKQIFLSRAPFFTARVRALYLTRRLIVRSLMVARSTQTLRIRILDFFCLFFFPFFGGEKTLGAYAPRVFSSTLPFNPGVCFSSSAHLASASSSE